MNMKKPYFFPIVIILLVCTCFIHQEQPLYSLLPDEDMVTCAASGYYDGMEADIAGAIPMENIEELFQAVTVKRGTSSESLSSPCFEIRAAYADETYIIVVGADNSVSVASVDSLASRTFWVDPSGELFESLYRLHLENGGTEFP